MVDVFLGFCAGFVGLCFVGGFPGGLVSWGWCDIGFTRF